MYLQNNSANWPVINGLYQFMFRNMVFGVTLDAHQLRFHHLKGESLLSSLVAYLEQDRELGELDAVTRHVYSDVIGSIRNNRSLVLVREADDHIVILSDEAENAYDELAEAVKALSSATRNFTSTYSLFVTDHHEELDRELLMGDGPLGIGR